LDDIGRYHPSKWTHYQLHKHTTYLGVEDRSHLNNAGKSMCLCRGQCGPYIHPSGFQSRPLLNRYYSGRVPHCLLYRTVPWSTLARLSV
jgi:hypothetical protein